MNPEQKLEAFIVDEIQLELEELMINCIIGAYEHEQLREQTLYLQLMLAMDPSHLPFNDQLEDTVNYAEVAEHIEQVARKGGHRLIETLAHSIAESLLLHYPLLQWVRIVVRKPQPIPSLRRACISLRLSRPRRA